MPPYSRDPNRGPAGVSFLLFGPYFKSKDPSTILIGDALTHMFHSTIGYYGLGVFSW